MTLFDCCNIKTHNSKFWPKNISQSDDFPEIAFKLYEKLNNYSFPKNINVKLQKFFGGFSTLLLPNTLKDNQILRSCRDDLSKIFGERQWKSYEEEQLVKLDKEKEASKKKTKIAVKKTAPKKDNGEKLD